MADYGYSNVSGGRRTPEHVHQERSVARIPDNGQQRLSTDCFNDQATVTYPDTVYPEDVGLPVDFGCMIWFAFQSVLTEL